ncbi:hypothetical protein PF003_g20021 [Phytophthora fragariae]|nr:hypothetical protein PF003_g20021 [Phytophthora fragariae]
MTTDTRIIVRPAQDALRAVGPIKTHADVPTPSDMEEKPPAPASKKHSGDPEVAKAASASKKPKVATTKAKAKPKPKAKVPATPKSTRKTKKVAASSKPASKKPPVKKPAAKQLPTKKGSAKEAPKTPKLPPKRTDVRLPGPYEEVSSDSSDTDTPNPGYVSGGTRLWLMPRRLFELRRLQRGLRLPQTARSLPLRGVALRHTRLWK